MCTFYLHALLRVPRDGNLEGGRYCLGQCGGTGCENLHWHVQDRVMQPEGECRNHLKSPTFRAPFWRVLSMVYLATKGSLCRDAA